MDRRKNGFALLELILVLAIISLLFQLFPSAWWWTVSVLDVRDWSRVTWFVANIVFLTVVVAVHVAPDIKRFFAERKRSAVKRAKREQQKRKAEDRQARRTRRRRIV